MKSKSLLKKQYADVIRNIYKKILMAAVIAIIIVFVLRNLFRGYVGNLITQFLCYYLQTDDWEYASFVYFTNVRNYYPLIIAVAVIFFFFITLRITLNGFTKYFDEILDGIDSLAAEQTEDIAMSEEVAFVAQKLQMVKDELGRRKREKEEAEKRKDELIVYLAHDIKTPLTSVIGYMSLLKENPQMKEEEREKYTEIAFNKALRLETLMNEFFEITRSHAQTMVLEKSTITLSYLLEQVVDELYPLLKKNEKEVEVSVEESIQIEIDPQRMARVFTNLIKNACHYSEGKIIRILCKKEENQVRLVFSNDGDVNKEQLERLFDKFYRLDEARQTKTGGAGLGLAISKEIVLAHQGTIEAQSEDGIFKIVVTLPVTA